MVVYHRFGAPIIRFPVLSKSAIQPILGGVYFVYSVIKHTIQSLTT